MDTDGWGVQFTNKDDSGSVKAKICTFINSKPVSSYSYLFGLGSSSLIDFSDVNTSNVTDMSGMFRTCSNLITIYVSDKFVTDKVTNASSLNMFTSSTKLVGGTSSPGYFTLKSN